LLLFEVYYEAGVFLGFSSVGPVIFFFVVFGTILIATTLIEQTLQLIFGLAVLFLPLETKFLI
jgi:hypothetical protein